MSNVYYNVNTVGNNVVPLSKLEQMFRIGKGADVKIFCGPVGVERNLMGYLQTTKGLKTIYNEMIRF